MSKNRQINNSGGYGTVHRKILQSQQLSWKGKLVYSLLAAYAGNHDKCWPGIHTIASDLQICSNTVRSGLNELKEVGIIKIDRNDGKSNEYLIKNYTPSPDEPLQDMNNTPSLDEGVPLQDMNNTPSPNEPEEEQEKEHIKLTGIITDYTFNFFWEEYHLKTTKPKTDKEPAKKYWGRLTAIEKKKACENIGMYAKTTDSRYLKKARTYLKDKNFNDEFKKLNDGNRYTTEDRDHTTVPGLAESN